MTLQIYTTDQMAVLLGCSTKTVEQRARDGDLPGLKFGDGGWVFPAGAVALRLDQLALDEAAKRRKGDAPAATTIGQQGQSGQKSRRGPKPRARPKLVDLGAAGAA